MEKSLSQIPFLAVKTLKREHYELKSLEGTIPLPAWQGFQSRGGPYNAMDGNGVSEGTVKMVVGDYTSAEELLSVSAEQVNAYRFLVERQSSIQESILNALLPVYKQIRIEYSNGEEEGLPSITAASQFKKHIGLSHIHVLDDSKDGFAYVGYEFGCSWDDEHGLGVMMHKERVVEIGAADTAFDSWAAEKDRDPIRAAEELKRHKTAPLIPYKKPWWKFW